MTLWKPNTERPEGVIHILIEWKEGNYLPIEYTPAKFDLFLGSCIRWCYLDDLLSAIADIERQAQMLNIMKTAGQDMHDKARANDDFDMCDIWEQALSQIKELKQ